MEYPLSYPGLEGLNLTVKQAGFSGAKLLQNGIPLKKQGGCYTVQNNAGAPVSIKLKSSAFDLVPKVVIGNDTIEVAPKLRWYGQLWAGLPLLLVFIGGLLGGLIGGIAVIKNQKILRSERSAPTRYALAGLISAGAFVVWFVAAAAIVMLVQPA
jgi:hypothetical protein